MHRLVFLLILLLFSTSAWGGPKYTVTVLPLYPVAINNEGHVAGHWQRTDRKPEQTIALWNGRLIDLDPTDAFKGQYDMQQASAINDRGQVVGHLVTSTFITTAPIFWSNGKLTKMDGSYGWRGARAHAIDNKGRVVGSVDNGNSEDIGSYAAIWANRTAVARKLGEEYGWRDSSASDINSRGDIAGWWRDDEGRSHIFLLSDGKMRDLVTLDPAFRQMPNVILLNDQQQIVYCAPRKDSTFHAFLWRKGKVTDLGMMDGWEVIPHGLNNSGLIVGRADDQHSKSLGFIWQNNKYTDLNTLVPQGKGWVIDEAKDINDRGEIIATGKRYGKGVGLLLRPVKTRRNLQ